MKLIRFDYPTATDFEQLLGALLPAGSRFNGVSHPAVNLSEDAEHYYVKVELPGVKKEDVTVELDNGVLTVGAKRTAACATECQKEVAFERSINLPEGIDPAKIQAVYENGLLTLTLAKPEAVKPRRIDVQ
jgi:HSP20 family protein